MHAYSLIGGRISHNVYTGGIPKTELRQTGMQWVEKVGGSLKAIQHTKFKSRMQKPRQAWCKNERLNMIVFLCANDPDRKYYAERKKLQ